MVTMLVMLLLIGTVVFMLSQMLGLGGSNVVDGQRQDDSSAAFFLAESGLEQAQAGMSAAVKAGGYTDAGCTALAVDGASLGRGTFSLSAVSVPASCAVGGATPCSSCAVTATGQAGAATRTVAQSLQLVTRNGVACNGSTSNCSNSPVTWQLSLRNGTGVAGVGIFNLTYLRQGDNQPTCAAGSNCRLQQNLTSPSNGVNSTGLMGNAVLIPAGSTYPIYQTMSRGGNSLAEVGVLFLGTTAPTLAGPNSSPGAAAFWDDNRGSPTNTVGYGGATTGGTTDGTASATSVCKTPDENRQACDSWCYGGDTLVFSFAGNVTALTDQLGSVTFGTNAGVGQNVAMTRAAKFPTAADVGAPANVDAEIWYARNPNLTGASPLGLGASSWKGRGTAAVGAQWVTNSATETSITTAGTGGSGSLTIGAGSALTGSWPAQVILPGDTVTSTAGSVTVTATIGTQSASLESGGLTSGRGGRGTYAVSNIRSNGTLVTSNGTTFNGNNRTWTVSSTVLNVTACSICFLAQGDAVALAGLSAGRTLNAAQSTPVTTFGRTEVAGGLGRYPLSGAATRVAPGATLYVGTPGTTLYLPATSSQPAVTSPRTLVSVKSGTGVLAPGTQVSAVGSPNAATRSFTVTATPTTALDGATVCAGTCAFFVPGGNTSFALGGVTGNFNEWAAGFTCLKGVDVAPLAVTSSSVASGRWAEVVAP